MNGPKKSLGASMTAERAREKLVPSRVRSSDHLEHWTRQPLPRKRLTTDRHR